MGLDTSRMRLSSEHKAFVRDLTGVVISYTPISGVIDTVKFSHKWFGHRKLIQRTVRHVKVQMRRNYIKSKSRKIMGKYKAHNKIKFFN
ncbi:MAG: hypothetical protein M1385_01690 [Candidatus Marsarchaeota archaeon]|nr:hypothetical protein [Candidatus Marsarchaeota archaeon]